MGERSVADLHELARAGAWGDVLSAFESDALLAAECSRYAHPGSLWTFLHQAAYFGHEGAARALIGLGASLTARSTEGQVPSEVAGRRGHAALQLLLNAALDDARGNLWAPSPDPALRPSSCGWAEAVERKAPRVMWVKYAGAVVTIPTDARYFTDSFGRVLVGWHGTYDPPRGMDGVSQVRLPDEPEFTSVEILTPEKPSTDDGPSRNPSGKRPRSPTAAPGGMEFESVLWRPDHASPAWFSHRVLRVTPTRVVLDSNHFDGTRYEPGTVTVNRETLRRAGLVWSTALKSGIYTASLKAEAVAERQALWSAPRGVGAEDGFTWPLGAEEMKKYFRSLALSLHPDQGGTNEGFIALQRSYERAREAAGIAAPVSPALLAELAAAVESARTGEESALAAHTAAPDDSQVLGALVAARRRLVAAQRDEAWALAGIAD